MINFEFDWETIDGAMRCCLVGTTCTGEDKEHSDQIYEQLDGEVIARIYG